MSHPHVRERYNVTAFPHVIITHFVYYYLKSTDRINNYLTPFIK